MDKLDFHFTIHCHQPVGNFEGVFRQAYEKCYKPFIETISHHPSIKFGLHISGPIWDWVKEHEPAFISDIERLAEREQVELISGGFYEPILEILTECDATWQIESMNRFISARFKQNPQGIWLTERVWDPSLPLLLSKLGIKYTTVDDTHFYYAGLEEKDIHGYYMTERAGNPLNIFPIQKKLRYAIPFKEPAHVIDLLKYYRDALNFRSVTYADDGEKFGVWPGTYDWVFTNGWLERFFTELEKHTGWLNITTQGEYLQSNQPTGRVYIPSASYEEMLEWALPADSIERFKNFEALLTNSGFKEYYKPFVRGGFWDNFLVKYPESNWMHKRTLYVSNMLSHTESMTGIPLNDARQEIFKSQSNCAYWHGLFGGVYLNYLRHAVYEHLLKAEELIDVHKPQSNSVSYASQDIDLDGMQEIVLKNKYLSLYIAPSKGGGIVEMDIRDHHFNITNVMARRKEAYHKLIHDTQAQSSAQDSPVTIHNLVKVKEIGLDQKLVYDWHSRYNFVEHFMPLDSPELERLYRTPYIDLGDFTLEEHRFLKYEGNAVFLARDGHLNMGNGTMVSLRMEKSYRLLENRMEAGYRLTNTSQQKIDIAMLVELNLTLLGTDDQRRIMINAPDGKDIKGMADYIISNRTTGFELIDAWQKLGIKVATPSLSSLFVYPVETISSSESGFERIYQGTCFILVYELHIAPEESRGISIPADFYNR
jgi:alpha-amylase